VEAFDRIVIGGGPGGYVAAIRMAQLGSKVALVERESVIGGTCLRVGCIPSKVLLESSELYFAARQRFAEHGLRVTQDGITFDLAAMMARKTRLVQELTDGLAQLMKKNQVTVFRGRGRLQGNAVVQVAGDAGPVELTAPAIVLATGSVPVALPGFAFDGQHIVSSTEALAFDHVPEHLVVVGGGAIGLELGSLWCRLGAHVTVVELLPQIVPFADKQAVQLLSRALKKQGLDILVGARVEQAKIEGDELVVSVRDKKGENLELCCDKLLVAVGRRPYTTGLGLEQAGVALEQGGRVQVDDCYATSAAGIYAIGDLIKGPMLAHKAEDEGVALAELLAGKAGHVSYDAIPSVVYTSPELAQVGLSEEQAKERGLAVRIGKFFFKGNGRAKSLGEEDGMVKLIADAHTDRLVGAHIVGPRASELIAEVVVAIELGASAEDLGRTVHAHPTLSEAIKEAALAVEGRAIHG